MASKARQARARIDERPFAVVDSRGETPEQRTWFKSTAEELARTLNNGSRRYRIISRYEAKKR